MAKAKKQKERSEKEGNPQKKSQISNTMLRGRRKALLALRQQFSSCSATTTTTTKKATTKAKSKNSKEQPCSALAIIADAGHGLGDFILVVFFPKENVIDKKKSALTPSLSLSFGYLLLTHSISLSPILSLFVTLCVNDDFKRRNFLL